MANKIAKPFLKWAGGKTQLINEIEKALPAFTKDEKFTFIEPFVGSGAVLFWMLNNFPRLERAVINDVNEDLINTYKTIRDNPNELIALLQELQGDFHDFEHDEDQKKAYYSKQRERYNTRTAENSSQAALFIFLNRTCFNGLYRVNSKNLYNVPMGSYKCPTICDSENIHAVSEALQRVDILCGDYEKTLEKAGKNSLFYFDPPYKPLSETSSFNSYAKGNFNDDEQVRLKEFCDQLHGLKHTFILSNSDVKDSAVNPDFFDNLYSKYTIERVNARRNINANSAKRGVLQELLITNQTKKQ